MKQIIISRKLGETCAVVVEDAQVSAIHIAHDDEPQLVGNIYKGRVKNFLPGMQAAFVDIGRDKNAFLQFNAPKNFSVGQSVLIQIDKDECGLKGARATLNISLAGRFLIFLPTLGYIGVSGKIRGEERQRLHALAKKIRPKTAGIIVRTAAADCDEKILLDELAKLQTLWAKILERNSKRKPPALLYSDNDLLEKILRDEYTDDAGIFIDNLKIYQRLAELGNVKFYDGDTPIFEAFGVAEEISKISRRELPLPGGGQIVIDRTEALTAIDVNTGKFIGDKNFDETILKTNLEAAELILKQLKLRDLGGIIVVDFIDMESDAHKKILMNFLRERAALDRKKTKIVDMTPLGLVEITRHSSHR
ncbi:MAG: Rne/Rng family ribonuclease [Selenomonadaceae bacterium]|nr:Rne/Rng family ribonuclease [Selenomonadaceae bacterium]